jgi:sugar phosphate isomerase/epimerase
MRKNTYSFILCKRMDIFIMPEIKPIGLQLYSVREALAEDFEGTVRRVAEMGYIGVEPYGGLPTDLNDAAALFNELGLQVFNSHVGIPEGDGKEALLKIAEAFNLSQVAIAFLPPEQFETIDAIKRSCEQLNQANEFAKSNNLKLGYHNHWWEFKELDGQSTLELILAELEQDIFLEVDTYWVQAGGMDVLSMLEAVGSRAPLIHVKDGSTDPEDSMLAVGDGKMPVPGIIDVTASTAEWYIVELDRCETDMLKAVEKSYEYLTSNGYAKGNN